MGFPEPLEIVVEGFAILLLTIEKMITVSIDRISHRVMSCKPIFERSVVLYQFLQLSSHVSSCSHGLQVSKPDLRLYPRQFKEAPRIHSVPWVALSVARNAALFSSIDLL